MNFALRSISGLFAILALAATQVTAQVVQGRVLDASTRAPVSGGIVKALGPGGELGTGTLTNDAGGFNLTLPSGFALRTVSVERIGYATQEFDAASFSGLTGIELLVGSAAIELGGILITSERLCRVQPGSGSSVQALWDEARKTLEITALSQADDVLRFETESYERDLEPDDYSVIRGTSRRSQITSFQPYTSISISQMTDHGWIEGSPTTGMQLYAPDASVLLTDAFANQHCFQGEVTPEAILLHFTPNSERRGLPEIEGTLILDSETAELTRLEFDYVGVPELRTGGHAGGSLEFAAAPNGMRVVQEWSIRGPVLSRYRSGVGSLVTEELRVGYVHEQGGRVLSVRTGSETITLPVEPLDLGSAATRRAGEDGGRVPSTRLLTGSRGSELVLRNDDGRPFRVTSVGLSRCINVALPCGEFELSTVVEPGESQVLMRIRKERILDPFSFEWDYEGESFDAPEPEEVEIPDQVADLIAAATPEPSAGANSSSRSVIREEIAEGRYQTALDFVRSRRPQWLRKRASGGFQADGGEIRVYLDGVAYDGGPDAPPDRALREIKAEAIETIEFVDGPTATIRWGTGNVHGAIAVTTRAAGRPG